MADDSTQIQTNSQQPAEATVDGLTVRQVPIGDQIAADRYAAAVPAVKNKKRGLRFTKLIPSGAPSDQQGNNTGSAGFDNNLQ